MAIFPVNTNRFDPYKSFRFKIYTGTNTVAVAGVSKITALKRSSDVIEYKEGGDPIIRKGLGRMKYEPITLERGVTQDNDFITWADTAQKLDQGIAGPTATSLKNLRREVRIELHNEEGQAVHGYLVHRCWVSEFQALPDLDAGASAVAIEHIKLENEGWEVDPTVTEQPET
jgi:phage tail-like protein